LYGAFPNKIATKHDDLEVISIGAMHHGEKCDVGNLEAQKNGDYHHHY